MAEKHGRYGTKIYKCWAQMKYRCDHPVGKNRHIYYDRGISYSERWSTFENFIADMGEKTDDQSLDRIDNEKGYSKENCRWATSKQQARNRRNNVLFEGKTLSEWSEILKTKRSTLAQRIYVYKWTIKKALGTAVQFGKR